MKEYKVEVRAYYPKFTLDKLHIVKTSSAEIQDLMDQYVNDGWQITSTNATSFGTAVYIYLYFEREK